MTPSGGHQYKDAYILPFLVGFVHVLAAANRRRVSLQSLARLDGRSATTTKRDGDTATLTPKSPGLSHY